MVYGTDNVHYQQAGRPLPPPPADYQPRPEPSRVQKRPRRRRRSPVGAIAAVIILLLLLLILFYTPIGSQFFGFLFNDRYPASSQFTVTRSVDVYVDNGEINYLIDFPRPSNIYSSAHNTQEVHYVTTPTGETIDKHDTLWTQWEGSTSDDFTVSVTYSMTVQTRIWDIDRQTSGLVSDIPSTLVQQQTGNEWEYESSRFKIWPTNPQIVTLADRLTSDSLTVYENVKSIYNYVQQEITYQVNSGGEPNACIETLQLGVGDCDDQSILLISLCRAAGIPSWLAFGALYDQYNAEWGPHAWAEIFIPLADGGSEEVTIDSANSEFLVRNCNRYEEWKSDGVSEHLEDYYHVITYNYTLSHPGSRPPTVELDERIHGTYTASSDYVSMIWYEQNFWKIVA